MNTNKADLLRLTAEQAQTALTALETADLLTDERVAVVAGDGAVGDPDLVAAVRQYANYSGE